MQTVKQIIQNNRLETVCGIRANQDLSLKRTTTLSNSQPTETNRKRIDRLFLSFTAFYGQLWRSQFKSDDFLIFMKKEWAQALQDMEDRHIDEAVKQCSEGKEYPPTLPHFVDLCKSAKKKHVFNNLKKEEGKKAKPEVALKHLAQIKSILQIKTK
jgi:hypothetical protein